MSSQAGFVTKNGNLSANALKRIFKDGVVPKKSVKRAKVVKKEPIEAIEPPLMKIHDFGSPKTLNEEV
jgi:hypothetical protein